uniref:VPS26 retromer complex component B n=1 Tax=Sarcophilus harrisii TaxID=9305 RepID=A0A7N4PGS7_SARHA
MRPESRAYPGPESGSPHPGPPPPLPRSQRSPAVRARGGGWGPAPWGALQGVHPAAPGPPAPCCSGGCRGLVGLRLGRRIPAPGSPRPGSPAAGAASPAPCPGQAGPSGRRGDELLRLRAERRGGDSAERCREQEAGGAQDRGWQEGEVFPILRRRDGLREGEPRAQEPQQAAGAPGDQDRVHRADCRHPVKNRTELYYDRGNHHEFVSLVKDLARPGEFTQSQTFDFEFTHVEKPYESYTGQNVKLRYFLRATISRRLNDVVKEMDIVVHTLSTYPELNSSIKMEVGIEDCLHIEFEYNKSKYHLKDVIVGKIYFLLVRIKIKHMEIDIIKRETTGTGPNVYHENDTIAKYEIMDGAPVRGESIPIRLFLAGYELTPTMRDINKKFSVRYYLNLVLIDEEERRYFKQQEVVLWRKGDIVRKSMSHQAAIASQRFEGTSSHPEARTPGQLSDNNSRQ